MYARPVIQKKRQAPRKSELKKFGAPVAGWVSNRALDVPMAMGDKQGAAVLDNFFPTSTTAILRRGKELYATLGDGSESVTSLFTYANGSNRKLFGSTATTIYDITTVLSPSNLELETDLGYFIGDDLGNILGQISTDDLKVFESTLGGNWVVEQFATTGGVFIVGVNGASTGFIFDGSQFYPYVDGGVSIISYDALTVDFTAGDTVTGGTSGATGVIYEVLPTNATEGALLITGITGTFQDNEALTDGSGGSATSASIDTVVAPGVTFPGSLTTADMSFVWVYKNRLWFIQKDSLNSWYMDELDAIGGSPEVYPLSGIMQKGGSLLWGAAWALESGASGGLSDQLVITSDQGEAAIFQGTFPGIDAGWTQTGVYRLGTPLGNRAFFKGGGDIAVATSVGLVPLSKAISLDVTALSPAAVSYNIQDAWQSAADSRGLSDWQCTIWPERKMAVISPPITTGNYDPVLFISNTETGAWCRYTNWDARALAVFEGEMYFGGADGLVYKANVSGKDDASVYTGVYLPLFDDIGMPANRKVTKLGRGVARARARINSSLQFKSDFNVSLGPAPTATAVDGSNAWGAGVWGQAAWGAVTSSVLTQEWKSIGGTGYAVSMAYQITSGSTVPLDAEIIRLEMTWTQGEMLS